MPELPPATPFASALAGRAKDQHARFSGTDEGDEPLRSQIRKYWTDLNLAFPGVEVPWSAVFVSHCVFKADPNAEFEFSPQHSQFVHDAINNPRAFRGVPIDAASIRVGDILQNNRGGTNHDFEFAKKHGNYASHSAIVIARGEDDRGKFAHTVGGNESDTIRRVRVQLNDDGTVRQKNANKYIALLKNMR